MYKRSHDRSVNSDLPRNRPYWRTLAAGQQPLRKTITAFTMSICLIGLLSLTQTTLASEDDTSLRKILASVADTPLANAPFIALKSSGLLAAPIESRGTLSFSANGSIEKHTTSPIDERTTVTVDSVRIERSDGQIDEVRFTENPALTAYAQGLRAILGGDAAPLYEHFLVELDGDFQQWRLTLRPKSVQLQTVVSSLSVTGASGLLSTIEMIETSGDVDTLTILLSSPSTPSTPPAAGSQ